MVRIGLVIVALVLVSAMVLGIGMGLGFVEVDSHWHVVLVHKSDTHDTTTGDQRVVSADDLLKQKGLTYQEPTPAAEPGKPATPAIAQNAPSAATPITPAPTKPVSTPTPTPAVAVKPANPAPTAVAIAQPIPAGSRERTDPPAELNDRAIVRVAAASKTPLTDPAGNVWEAASGFEGGEVRTAAQVPIENTHFPALYAGRMWSPKLWKHNLPNGEYTVLLHFAETDDAIKSPGVRVFDMDVQDQHFAGVDIMKEAGAWRKAVVRSVPVVVKDGTLTVRFAKTGEHFPFICGIEVIPGARRPADAVAGRDAERRQVAFRVDAGSPTPVRDPRGNTWDADSGFDGGEIVDRGQVDIANTDFPDIYRTEHFNMTGWHKAVPNGGYTVNLHFAETWKGIDDSHPRIFDVSVQGNELHNLNVLKETGGIRRALVKTFHVTVTDGNLAVLFRKTKDDAPEINGIEVIQEPPPLRINAGSPAAARDPRGNTWEPESGFDDGKDVDRGAIAIANTDFPDLYRTEHWDMTSWSKWMPNGKYVVNLHFAETSEHINDAHPRIFTVVVQGNELRDLNVAKEAGGNAKALVKTFHVNVTDGKLSIQFRRGQTDDGPELNGIEVLPEH